MLSDLHVDVAEHGAARLVVDLGLERVAVLQRAGALRRRTRADLVDQPLQVREFRPGILAEHERHMRAQPHTSMSTIV